MRIGNNISAMNTLNRLTVNNSMLSKSLEKLSSGSAINRAADNAAGLAISEKMRAQIAGLEQASKNAQDGISLVQTAEGALDQTHTALRRMYTLAMQAKNGTITTEDRQKIQDEINARINEIDRVASTSNFNGIKLFDGSLDSNQTETVPTASATISGSASATGLSVVFGTDAAVDDTAKQSIIDLLGENDITLEYSGSNWSATATKLGGFDVAYSSNKITLAKDSVTYATINVTPGGGAANDTITLSFSGGNVAGKALELQIGATSAEDDKIEVSISKMDAGSLLVDADGNSALTTVNGVANTLDMTTADAAAAAIDSINRAIERVSTQRAGLGAVQNRLEQTIENLSTTAENMSAAESRIRDVDMAKEMTTFTKYSILSQAAQAMLAQANALPQGVLQLLG